MRTETRTVRVGEWLGPVDWENFDFADATKNTYPCNPELRQGLIDNLREIEAAFNRGDEVEATTDGGIPRCGWGKVLNVGMYDGWPFWKPMPTILVDGYLGAEPAWFGTVKEFRVAATDAEGSAE